MQILKTVKRIIKRDAYQISKIYNLWSE